MQMFGHMNIWFSSWKVLYKCDNTKVIREGSDNRGLLDKGTESLNLYFRILIFVDRKFHRLLFRWSAGFRT